MEDKRLFAYAVIIALVVPAIIGTMYFLKTYDDNIKYTENSK